MILSITGKEPYGHNCCECFSIATVVEIELASISTTLSLETREHFPLLQNFSLRLVARTFFKKLAALTRR